MSGWLLDTNAWIALLENNAALVAAVFCDGVTAISSHAVFGMRLAATLSRL